MDHLLSLLQLVLLLCHLLMLLHQHPQSYQFLTHCLDVDLVLDNQVEHAAHYQQKHHYDDSFEGHGGLLFLNWKYASLRLRE